MKPEAMFELVSINISSRKGTLKKPVKSARLIPGHGMEGDAHAGNWPRQVSLLAEEDIDTMRGKGFELRCGDFAENLTTRGVDLAALPIGSILIIGNAELEVTQIGKQCHGGCEVLRRTGDCVMPRRGIFARVIKGGDIRCDDRCYYRVRQSVPENIPG